jgi:hypothetical protein
MKRQAERRRVTPETVSRVKQAGLVPNNEPMPLMHGPPEKCANCGMRITAGPENGRSGHLRRAGMPNVLEQRELYEQGLIDPRGHWLPWWDVVFVCADRLVRWRQTPAIRD